MLPFGYIDSPLAPHPLAVLLFAIGLDALLGDSPRLFRIIPHPVVVIGRLIDAGERKLNRPTRSEADRRLRGVLFLLAMMAGAAAIGWAISFAARTFPHAWIAEVFVVATLIAQRSLLDHVAAVAAALGSGLAAGRQAVALIVGRDPASLDEHGVARAAIESCAENFSDGVVAPVFWFVLFGLPGLMVYKTVNTLDSMIGHMNERHRAFGMASARMDDALNLIPARLSGLLIALAATFAPKARGWAALKVMLKDAGKHRSPNAGWPEAAMAGALGLALGGPRRYPGLVVADPWLGEGSAKATAGDIARALRVFALACVLHAAGVAGLLWLQTAG